MTDLERRLRRVILLAAGFGIAAALVGMLTGELVFARHTDELLSTRRAGGWPLVAAVGAVLTYGAWLWSHPRRSHVIGWIFVTFAALVCFVIASFHLDPFHHKITLWPTHAMLVLGGTMLALIGPVALAVTLFSSREPPAPDQSARVVTR